MIAPDIAAQQMQLQRRQQMIDMLKQQGSTPLEQQTVTGAGPARVVPISAFQGLAKLLQAGAGAYFQKSEDKKSAALNQDMSDRMSDVLSNAPAGSTKTARMASMLRQQSAQEQPPSDQSVSQNQDTLIPDAAQQGQAGPIGVSPQAAMPMTQQSQGASQPMINALRGNVTQSQPQPAQSQPDNRFGLPALIRGQLIGQMGGDPASQAYWKQSDPTDATRMAVAGGLDPRQANIDALNKANHITPTRLGEGAYADTSGQIQGLPTAAPPGFVNIHAPDGSWSTKPVSGGLDAVSASNAATLQGKNQQTLTDQNLLPVDTQGRPIPRTISQTIANSGFPAGTQVPSQTQSGVMQPGQDDRISILKQELAATTNPSDIAALNRAIARIQPQGAAEPQGVGLALGQKEGAVNAQTELSKKFADLNTANQQAQTTNSYLQSIKSLADKAGVGGFSDRTQLANNLLSYAGVSEKATDAVTAKNLLDKYSNQITARLGGGANGSDARSAIIEAAYPNSTMTPAAIKDAADNLIGANDMIKAKASILSPHANARDPVTYQQKEQVFDQNADPRIYQYKNISDPKQRAAFAASVLKQDPNFGQKIDALHSIGAY
jgi:hypothetical protein